MDPGNFKNIIFDYGGVIINIDPQLTIDAFGRMAHQNVASRTPRIITDPIFHQFEMGLVSVETFRNEICRLLDIEIDQCPGKYFDAAWNAMLLDIPMARLELLKRLAEKHRLFLLSNTNAIHIRKVSEIVQNTINEPSIDHFFECAYYSHEVHMRKPNKDIFEFVLGKHGLLPSETLFLDDNPENFVGANESGIATIEVDRDILEIFA